MNPMQQSDKLDRILLEQDIILPSSGFAASVMEAIDERAAAPAPIPFPWKIALPAIVVLLMGLAALACLGSDVARAAMQSSGSGADWFSWLTSAAWPAVMLRTEAAPAVLALAASWACVMVCRRLIGGGWRAS